MSPVRSFEDALRYLYGFINYEQKPSRMQETRESDLVRFRRFLDELGGPQRTVPGVLVAGTNGKGTTSYALAELLATSGRRVGLFSSPHLGTIRERYRINGDLIPEHTFVELVARIQAAQQALSPSDDLTGFRTTFEQMTALAFLWFASEGVDIAVYEVGLGGRLDCTNIIDPVLSVVTAISYDHQDVLGPTLTHIATEKAGIFRPGTPALTGPQHDEASQALAAHARSIGTPLSVYQPTYATKPHQQEQQLIKWRGSSYPTSLLGSYQQYNLGLALEATELLPEPFRNISDEHRRATLAKLHWPGRFEVLVPSSETSPAAPLVLCDGAHNIGGAEALRAALDEAFPGRKTAFVTSFSTGKKPRDIVEALLRSGDAWWYYQRSGGRAMQLADVTEAVGREPRLLRALGDWREIDADIICLCGSLVFLGEVRHAFLGAPVDPQL